ncbi:MAG TPA: hypothetical protein DD435_04430, partial [Cyanobacteria bacterium UBA8530]|nr:hypothetical protein [Cyanobacteria bacterium UBA8530]
EKAEVHLFTPWKPELEKSLDARVKFQPTLPLSLPGEKRRNLFRQINPLSHLRNARLIRKAGLDVVHFVTAHPSNSLLIPLLGNRLICFTQHDPSCHLGEGSSLRDYLNRRTARLSHRIVAHGQALKDALSQKLPPERIEVIPHGDYGFFKRFAKGEPSEETILFFGRFIPYKGIDVLCKAERLLRKRLDSYEICIAGEGEVSFDSWIDPESRIRVINRFLPDEEVAQLFQQARMVVLPYLEASQSGVLAIAFAFGKPSIVSEVGGLPEAVDFGKAGLIIPANDPEALADAIERLWRQPELRKRIGEGGRDLVEKTIGWPLIAERHIEMYRQLVAD